MSQRIYVTKQGDAYPKTYRLVRANTPAAARNHIARDSIQVEVATQDDLVNLIALGHKVEETSTGAAQQELGE